MQNENNFPAKRAHLSLPLLAAGVACLLAWAFLTLYQYNPSIFSSRNTLLRVDSFEEIRAQKQPIRQSIPVAISFGSNTLPIQEATVSANMWPLWSDKVSHLAQSARPGEGGNIVMYAHNTKTLFGPLKWYGENNTEIRVTNLSGEVLIYKPEHVYVVSPKDTSILKNSDEEILTLYTCTGLFDSERLVVKAKRVNPNL